MLCRPRKEEIQKQSSIEYFTILALNLTLFELNGTFPQESSPESHVKFARWSKEELRTYSPVIFFHLALCFICISQSIAFLLFS